MLPLLEGPDLRGSRSKSLAPLFFHLRWSKPFADGMILNEGEGNVPGRCHFLEQLGHSLPNCQIVSYILISIPQSHRDPSLLQVPTPGKTSPLSAPPSSTTSAARATVEPAVSVEPARPRSTSSRAPPAKLGRVVNCRTPVSQLLGSASRTLTSADQVVHGTGATPSSWVCPGENLLRGGGGRKMRWRRASADLLSLNLSMSDRNLVKCLSHLPPHV